MSSQPRDRRERTAKRRETILAAATQVFAEKAYRAADVQGIADRAGIAKGTVYLYFRSKEELFLAALDRGLQGLREEMNKVRREVPHPLARIKEAIAVFLAYFDDRPELVELLIQERAGFRRQGKLSFLAWTEEEHRERRRFFDELHERGYAPHPIADRIVDTIAEFLYGTIVAARFSERGPSLRARTDDIVHLLLHGLLGSPASPDENRKRGPAS